jgi:hypothetical protein
MSAGDRRHRRRQLAIVGTCATPIMRSSHANSGAPYDAVSM